jgi:hypothetical protein
VKRAGPEDHLGCLAGHLGQPLPLFIDRGPDDNSVVQHLGAPQVEGSGSKPIPKAGERGIELGDRGVVNLVAEDW